MYVLSFGNLQQRIIGLATRRREKIPRNPQHCMQKTPQSLERQHQHCIRNARSFSNGEIDVDLILPQLLIDAVSSSFETNASLSGCKEGTRINPEELGHIPP